MYTLGHSRIHWRGITCTQDNSRARGSFIVCYYSHRGYSAVCTERIHSGRESISSNETGAKGDEVSRQVFSTFFFPSITPRSRDRGWNQSHPWKLWDFHEKSWTKLPTPFSYLRSLLFRVTPFFSLRLYVADYDVIWILWQKIDKFSTLWLLSVLRLCPSIVARRITYMEMRVGNSLSIKCNSNMHSQTTAVCA